MSSDEAEKARQRRALGRLLIEVGGVLSDDEKRARIEAKVHEIRDRIGSDPRKAMELVQAIADALRGGR